MSRASKHSISLIIMALITLIWALAVQAQTQSNAPSEQDISPTPGTDVEKQFHKARENFLKRDYQNAATEIRQAAAFLKEEAEHATGEGKQALLASARELGQLADRGKREAYEKA